MTQMTLLFFVLGLISMAAAQCPRGVLYDAGSQICYKLETNLDSEADWTASMQTCSFNGLHLLQPFNPMPSKIAAALSQYSTLLDYLPIGLYRDAGSSAIKTPPFGAVFTGTPNFDTANGEPKAPVKGQKQCGYVTLSTGLWKMDVCTNTSIVVMCNCNTQESTPTPQPAGFITQSGLPIAQNAFYMFVNQTMTKADAVKFCTSQGASVYGFEDGEWSQQYLPMKAGLPTTPDQRLTYWTDASRSGNAWKFIKGIFAVGAKPPMARPHTNCLAYEIVPQKVGAYIKSTCDKKYRFFCRKSSIDPPVASRSLDIPEESEY